jgi:hypothetical protein
MRFAITIFSILFAYHSSISQYAILPATAVKNASFSIIAPVVCDPYTAPDGQVYSTSGQCEALIMNYLGCYSNVAINLQVNPSYDVWDNHIASDSYTWIDGQTNSTTNYNATYTYQSFHGCDSVIHLNLEIGYSPDTAVVYPSVIDVHEFNGILYEQEGIYYQTLINQFGCESVIQLVLCFDYTGIGTLPNNELIYPNPSQDGVFYLPKLHQNCTLEL